MKDSTIISLANSDLYTVLDFGKTDSNLDKVVPLGNLLGQYQTSLTQV